ncbi:MAG: PH domain-containing protein [Candidatus Hydrogenedentes bacterium]|nr:PH domain-containing protein [Candidatus Hydrogenedentota bacterium]
MEEQTLWKGASSQVLNMGTFILCGLTFWLIVPIFIAFWKWLVLRCSVYEITTERIRLTKGVFSKQTEEIELYRVKDLNITQPFFLRMFSLGSIHLQTSDRSAPDFILRALPKIYELRDLIRKHVELRRDQKRVREVDME